MFCTRPSNLYRWLHAHWPSLLCSLHSNGSSIYWLPFPNRPWRYWTSFSNFFFFWKWIMFCQSAPLHPGLTSSQANNPIKANTLNVNWPYRHPFPICHWQHFWEEFLSEFFFSSSHTCEIPIHHNNQCWVSIYQALNASTLLWQVEPRGFTF